MGRVPKAVRLLLDDGSKEFSDTVWVRFRSTLFAAVLIAGSRTKWRLYRFAGGETAGHFSSFHRVFSHRRWQSIRLAPRLVTVID